MNIDEDDKVDKSLQICIVRALKCSIALRSYEANELTTHIALSCGRMYFATLGGFQGHWTYLLNGPCIAELCSCLNDASPKQVVMTPQCNDLIRNTIGTLVASFATTEMPSGNFILDNIAISVMFVPPGSRIKSIPSSTEMTEVVKSFIPSTVVSAIENGTFDSMAELREVTTLFLSLDSYCKELYSDPITLQSFFLMVQEAMHDTGGFMRQFLIDDKGCVLIIMWGVPSFSYPNNPARAIDCAVSICLKASAIGHKCSIGITTGSVYCGNIGSVVRRDFVGIGDKVNIAARLMGKAHGRILLDLATFQRLPHIGHEVIIMAENLTLKGVGTISPYAISDFADMPHLSVTGADILKKKSSVLRKEIVMQLSSIISEIAPDLNPNGVTTPQPMETTLVSYGGFDFVSPRSDDNSITPTRVIFGSIVRQDSTLADNTVSILSRMNSINEPKYGSYELNSFGGFDGSDRDAELLRLKFTDMGILSNEVKPSTTVKYVVIRGPPGCGKTTAASYVRTYASHRGITCICIRCRAGDESTRYIVLRKLFRQMIGSKQFITEHQQRTALTVLLKLTYMNASPSDIAMKLESILEKICGGRGDRSKSSRVRADTESVGDKWLHEVLAYVVQLQRYVIIVEDAHFCDELSWNQFKLLADMCTNLVVVLTIREAHYSSKGGIPRARRLSGSSSCNTPTFPNLTPTKPTNSNNSSLRVSPVVSPASKSTPSPGPVIQNKKLETKTIISDAYETILKLPNCVIIEIRSLSMDDVRLLLQQMLPSKTVSEDVVKHVLDLSAGSPFWCKAIAGYIMESGYEAFTESIHGVEFQSHAIDGLILSRFERLNSTQQVVVKHASVIGDEFTYTEISAVLPSQFKQEKISASFAALIDAGFLYTVDEQSKLYGFQNAIIRDVLYDLIPPR